MVAEGADVTPLVSYQVAVTDSRYGKAADYMTRMKCINGKDIIQTIGAAEIRNKQAAPLEALVISPCTGCTMSKLADGTTDTPVLMMAKELFRNNKPVVLGLAANDGLGISAKSLGALLSTKNVCFIPFGKEKAQG